MKYLVAVVFLVGTVAAGKSELGNVGYCNAENFCKSDGVTLACNAKLAGFNPEPLADHVNEQLTTSFSHLILAKYYNTYLKNRPGFNKLFQGLSDKAWDNAVELIKHITKRGGKISKVGIIESPDVKLLNTMYDEVEAMGVALNYEKKLATAVQTLHHGATHHSHQNIYDPETAHYLAEEFLEPQTETIRKLSGYVNDLTKFGKTSDRSLGIFLFDEYLEKQ